MFLLFSDLRNMLGLILHEKKLCSDHLSIISRSLFDNIVNIRKNVFKETSSFLFSIYSSGRIPL